jgi:DNA-binding transcriptional regulator GbsR (MarR family)
MTPPRPARKKPDAGWQDTFVEELGALGPELGLPRATMRITAWMMVCDPPEQSARRIQNGVHLSAAAVSAATRQLLAAGMLERVSRPGDRQTYYRLAAGSWDAPLEAKLRALSRLRHVADKGIAAARNQADYRLIEMRDAFAFFEDQLDQHIRKRHLSKPS